MNHTTTMIKYLSPEMMNGEMLKSDFVKITWLRSNRGLLSKDQWEFVDSIRENRPLVFDTSKKLDQIYYGYRDYKKEVWA